MIEPLPILLFRQGRLRKSEQAPKARTGLKIKLLRLRAPGARGKAGQDRIALLDEKGAAAGDFQSVVAGLGQVREGLTHGGGGLQIMLGRHPAPIVLTEVGAIGDAEQSLVRSVHILGGEIHIVGGHERNISLVGEGHEVRLGARFRRQTVTLQLHIKPVFERLAHNFKRRPPLGNLVRRHQGINWTIRAARQQDQPGVQFRHLGPRHERIAPLPVQITHGRQGHQVQPAGLVLHQKGDRRRPGPTIALPAANSGNRKGAPDDGLNARILHRLGEFERTKQISPVGQPKRRHPAFRRQPRQIPRPNGAFQQGVGRANPQMHKGGLRVAHKSGLAESSAQVLGQ